MKRIISFLLILCLSFSFTVFADENTTTQNTTEKVEVFEGIILKDSSGNFQFATSKQIYNLNSSNEEILGFLDIIANNGVKVIGEGKIKDNEIDLSFIKTQTDLPDSLKENYYSFLKEHSGVEMYYKDALIISTDDILQMVHEDKIYNITAENPHILKVLNLLANTGEKVYLEGIMTTDNFKIIFIATMEELTGELKEEYQKIYNEALAENQKVGVVISEGKDSYLLVEENSNKMYYLKTDDENIRQYVPIFANKGQKIRITYKTISENILNVLQVDVIGELDNSIEKEVEVLEKKVQESTLYYVDGKILKEKEDYNIIFTVKEEEKNVEKKLGIVCDNEEVIKTIKTVANENVDVRITGYINYEKTLLDARKITITSKNLDNELKEKLDSTTSTNINNTQNTPTTNNSDFSSLFANFGNFDLNNFGNFGSLFGNNNNQSGDGTTSSTNSLFANFGNFDLSNFGNFGSLFGNNNNQSGDGTTSSTNSLFANFGNFDLSQFNGTGLFSNLNLSSLFSGSNITSNNQNTDSTAFAQN